MSKIRRRGGHDRVGRCHVKASASFVSIVGVATPKTDGFYWWHGRHDRDAYTMAPRVTPEMELIKRKDIVRSWTPPPQKKKQIRAHEDLFSTPITSTFSLAAGSLQFERNGRAGQECIQCNESMSIPRLVWTSANDLRPILLFVSYGA